MFFNELPLNITKAKDVRWLSRDRAVSHLRECFLSVTVSFVERSSGDK